MEFSEGMLTCEELGEGVFEIAGFGVFGKGGKVVLVAAVPDAGVSRGAGCRGGLVETGNEFIGPEAPNPFEFPKGDATDSGGVEANPLDGALLNISKPLDELPVVLAPMGPGPETSGILWSALMRSSSPALSGVSVPFIATYPPYKTKSSNTTTIAVLMVCTAVLPDRTSNLNFT